jgi:hypothetical protein
MSFSNYYTTIKKTNGIDCTIAKQHVIATRISRIVCTIAKQHVYPDRGLDSRYGLTKVVGFLRVLRFPPTGKVDSRVG